MKKPTLVFLMCIVFGVLPTMSFASNVPVITGISPSAVNNAGIGGPDGKGGLYDSVKITGSYGANAYLMMDGKNWTNPDIAYLTLDPSGSYMLFGISPTATPGVHTIQIGDKTGGSNPVLLPPSNSVLLTVLDNSTRAPVWQNASFDNYSPVYAGKSHERIDFTARYINEADTKITLDGERISATLTKSPYYQGVYTIGFTLPATLTAGTHYIAIASISGAKAKSEALPFTVLPLPAYLNPDPSTVIPDPEITLTQDVTSTTLGKIITIKVATKNTIGNSSWEYFAPGTAYGVVKCSSAGTASGLEISCIAYEPGGTSVYAELHNGGKVYKSNTIQISFGSSAVTPQVIPELNLVGDINGSQSPYTINMKAGETLVVRGAPKNVKSGVLFKLAPQFQSSCSSDISNSRVWVFTCKLNTQMSEFFYVEITQDGKTYKSNLIKINVNPVVIPGDSVPYLYVVAESNGIRSPYALKVRPGTEFVLTGEVKNLKIGSVPKYSWTTLVASSCITGKPSDTVWTLSCIALAGSGVRNGDFALKMLQDGKEYVSNIVRITVDSTVLEIDKTVKNTAQNSQQDLLEKISFLQKEIAKQKGASDITPQSGIKNTTTPDTSGINLDIPNRVGCTDISRTIKVKSVDTASKNDVTDLQSYLAEKGYLKASPSGFFGQMTSKAVMTFQKAYGIQATGIAGPMTRAKIKTLTCN